MADALYECKFCKKKMLSERIFMRHTCTPMQRSQDIQSVIGQSAYGLYKIWLEKQRRKPPEITTFMTSMYYTAFMNFAKWVRETGIAEPSKYVELMLAAKISPSLWRKTEAYQIYLDHFDRLAPPLDHAIVTVETLLALAEGFECEPQEVFSKMMPGEVLELIQQRRLSPWLLFCSKSFKEWITTIHEHDRTMLMSGIGIDYWSMKMSKDPGAIAKLKAIAQDLGI